MEEEFYYLFVLNCFYWYCRNSHLLIFCLMTNLQNDFNYRKIPFNADKPHLKLEESDPMGSRCTCIGL